MKYNLKRCQSVKMYRKVTLAGTCVRRKVFLIPLFDLDEMQNHQISVSSFQWCFCLSYGIDQGVVVVVLSAVELLLLWLLLL